MAAPITLVIMARNAAKTIEACLESAVPHAQEVIFGFGGKSTDGTEELVKTWLEANIPDHYQLVDIEWHDDFAAARNEIWSRVKTEWALWLDSDDILLNGELLERRIAENNDASGLWMPYHYDEDEFGNLSCTLIRERVMHHPAQWHWEGAIHEVLIHDGSEPLNMVLVDDVVVRHNPARDKAKGERNLDILYRELERTEPDPPQRLLYYLARENAARGNLKDAIGYWKRYMGRAEVNEEAYQVAFLIADTLRAQGRLQEASRAALSAIEVAPAFPDAYYLLAKIAYQRGAFDETIEWTKAGQTKPAPKTQLIVDPRQYDYWPMYFLGMAYRGMGDHEMALANLVQAAQFVPDEAIKKVIAEEQQSINYYRTRDAFLTLYEQLGRNDEWLKVRKLFRVAPKSIEQDPLVREKHIFAQEVTMHVDDPAAAAAYYGDNPNWTPFPYEALTNPGWATHPRMKFARESIKCDPPVTILDVGSSDGFISLPLALDGHIVQGYDLDLHCVDEANARAQKLGVAGRARYQLGTVADVHGKYDVALALEIIEHLPDPMGFLDELDKHARKVILTTPFLAWESGRWPEWDKHEMKGHIRIYDLADLETMLTGRGRIIDLYRQPSPDGLASWIFASYRPRQEHTGRITFLAPGTLEEWSPRKLREQGLGGSETALIRLAEEMFLEGEKFSTVYGRIDNPGYYNGVRYRPWEAFVPSVRQDAVVAWRYPEAADIPLRTERLILWTHDVDYGDRLTPARANAFHKIVVLSQWHKSHMMETYPWLDESKLIVIGNGVEVERFKSKGQRNPHRVAFTSSPDRGLDLILEHVWPLVLDKVPDAELHIYYGFNNFNALKDSRPDLAYFARKTMTLIAASHNVVNHGRLPQDQLAEELKKTAVWIYPSQTAKTVPFEETYCISAVEAQLAGAIPVSSRRGALNETVAGGIAVDGMIGTEGVAEQYVAAVVALLTTKPKELAQMRRKIRANVPAQSWAVIANEWLTDVLSNTKE